MFDYVTDTEITLGGNRHVVRFADGMTGIGSRRYWLDGREGFHDAVRQTADITKGNHFLYDIKWRDNPWDRVHIFIHEDELPALLSEENRWREPRDITPSVNKGE